MPKPPHGKNSAINSTPQKTGPNTDSRRNREFKPPPIRSVYHAARRHTAAERHLLLTHKFYNVIPKHFI
jgi:hypothetical protein